MQQRWVNLIPGVPTVSNFSTTQGQGSPICINTVTGAAYYLDATGAVQLLSNIGSLTLTEVTAASISNPAAGFQTLFLDTADHKLKRKDSSGTVTIIG